jgi:hypothetical protein
MLVCKRSVAAFVGIFFIGWVLGIFFVITFLKGFRGDDDGALGGGNLRKRPPLPPRPLSRGFPEVHNDGATAGLASVNEIIRHHHAITSEILSNLNDSAADRGGKYQIFFDWPVTVSLFTLVNYKALESVMNVYGADINYRVLLPAPVIGGSQRFSNQLSLNQFRKYERRGYDIQVEAVGQMDDIGYPSTVARDYWSKWSARCCLHCGRKCRNTDRTQPFHVHMFIRLSKLWQYGGLFTDFSFFFVGPLDAPMITQVRFVGYVSLQLYTKVCILHVTQQHVYIYTSIIRVATTLLTPLFSFQPIPPFPPPSTGLLY